jgi:H/ACA ribonucleoprotein complex subunit 3
MARFVMRKCTKCGSYGLSEKCVKCGGETIMPHPPKFSPDDKYLELRMKSLGYKV